jgi:hypothetical protein
MEIDKAFLVLRHCSLNSRSDSTLTMPAMPILPAYFPALEISSLRQPNI